MSQLSQLLSLLSSEQALALATTATLASLTTLYFYLTRTIHSRREQLSRVIPGTEGVHISVLCPTDEIIDTPYEGVETVFDAFQRGLGLNAHGNCLGKRVGSDYQWLSYEETDLRIRRFGSGLVHNGIVPREDVYVAIMGINCIDWVISMFGCTFFSITYVPMYDTLGEEAMFHILAQTKCQVIITHPDKMSKVQSMLKKCETDVRLVIKMECDLTDEDKEGGNEKLELKSMREVEEEGKNMFPMCLPTPESIYTICYTSGTTGKPKGVLITHKNLTATLAGLIYANKDFILSPSDVHISYLPLCHLFEVIAQIFAYTGGASIGFHCGDIKKLSSNIQALRPTIFPAAPRVLNKIHDRIMTEISTRNFAVRSLFNYALNSKKSEVCNGVIRKDSFWDKIVFKKIQAKLGGRVRLVAVGSAPMAPEILQFFRATLGAKVYEGYGQTESTAGCSFTTPTDITGGHVGPPLPQSLIKLIDVPEKNYYAKDGCGEICVKGPNVFSGYYKNEEETSKALDQDGWLHSGDIGKWNNAGCLVIIDRKKNIFKLSQGEYIAPEKVENCYQKNPFVNQIFVNGNSLKASLAAVLVPDPEYLRDWAKNNGYSTLSFQELCTNKEINKIILDSLNETVATELKGFEKVRKVYIEPTEFSIENDLVTPTLKKKRASISVHYNDIFDEMYRSME